MNPVWGHIIGVVTVVLMVLFVGIWIWAWRKKHKQVFDEMAELPMEDPLGSPTEKETGSKTP